MTLPYHLARSWSGSKIENPAAPVGNDRPFLSNDSRQFGRSFLQSTLFLLIDQSMHLTRIEQLCVTKSPYPIPIRIFCCGSSELRCEMPPYANESAIFIDLNTGRITSRNNDGLAHRNAQLKWKNPCTNLESLTHRRRANGKVFDTRITWKDATDGLTNRFTIKGQQTTCAVRPKDSNLVFVGTRTNSAVGKGACLVFEPANCYGSSIPLTLLSTDSASITQPRQHFRRIHTGSLVPTTGGTLRSPSWITSIS